MELITDREIYERIIRDAVPSAGKFVWIATADLKDLYVDKDGGMAPFLEVLSELVEQGVEVRLIHAKEPGPAFQEDFDRYPNLIEGLERMLCPRMHVKAVVVDGRLAFLGSANLTGAGMGAKSENRRNFEAGVVSTDPEFIKQIMDLFDRVWIGSPCEKCGRKEYCSEHLDLVEGKGI